MSEHEKLKWICDEIGYELYYNNGKIDGSMSINKLDQDNGGYINIKIDVREIIFTPEFMDKYGVFLLNKYIEKYHGAKTQQQLLDYSKTFYTKFFSNLDNPVQYLHNLILG